MPHDVVQMMNRVRLTISFSFSTVRSTPLLLDGVWRFVDGSSRSMLTGRYTHRRCRCPIQKVNTCSCSHCMPVAISDRSWGCGRYQSSWNGRGLVHSRSSTLALWRPSWPLKMLACARCPLHVAFFFFKTTSVVPPDPIGCRGFYLNMDSTIAETSLRSFIRSPSQFCTTASQQTSSADSSDTCNVGRGMSGV